ATAELPYGKPQAGVLFQTSCTVGLLFRLRPSVVRLDRRFTWVAKRKSALSTPSFPVCGSNVTCRKPPTCGVISPPVKRLSWSGNSTVPFCVPGSAFLMLVYDVWNIKDTGATRLSSRLCCPSGLLPSRDSLLRNTYPLSLKARPVGVSSGKCVWQALHARPVWRA